MAVRVRTVVEQAASAAGWTVEAVTAEGSRLLFTCRRGESPPFVLWLKPDRGGDEPCLAANGVLRMGYRGQSLSEQENLLLKRVLAALEAVQSEGAPLDFAGPEEGDEPEKPLSLMYSGWQFELRVTLACNEQCIFCNSHNVAENLARNRSQALTMVRQARDAGAVKLVITGGEPLLVPWLPDLARRAREVGYEYLVVQTNGVLLAGDSGFRLLEETAPDEVLVSIHGSNRETVAAITGRGDLFDSKVEGYRRALNGNWHTSVSYVLCRQNMHDAESFVRFLAGFHKRPFLVSYSCVAPSGRAAAEGKATVPRMRDAAPVMLAALRLGAKLGLNVVLTEYCGIPTCVEPRLRDFLEPFDPDRSPGVPPDKTMVDRCASCDWKYRCSGIFRNYLKLYPDHEFA